MERIRLALQKSGRLAEPSMALLAKAGIQFDWRKGQLYHRAKNFPLDVMLLRDDDIPQIVADGTCDLGIAGQNVIEEKLLSRDRVPEDAIMVRQILRFGACRLAIAVPDGAPWQTVSDLAERTIATSYPYLLRRFLQQQDVSARIIEISGSVEVAPAMGVADAICDLVSTGGTLRSNGLRELAPVFSSEAQLIQTKQPMNPSKEDLMDRLGVRMAGVEKAQATKYIMMHAPRSALDAIMTVIPGMEKPTMMPLSADDDRVALHAVAAEEIFWETMEQLKQLGASSILVLPIEKILA